MTIRKILITDDDPDIRTVSRISLEANRGFEVYMASSGEEAFEKAVESVPDAILLDVMMPKMDGYATIELLKRDERTREIPVIFLSARTSTIDREKGNSLGAAGYINKPFDPMNLAKEIRKILGWPEHE